VAACGSTELTWTKDVAGPDGMHTVSLSGVIPAGANPRLRVYRVPSPSRYAETTFGEALESAGIQIGGRQLDRAHEYNTENEVAEHVSPALREEAKVTLKVSQNLHASLLPFVLGSYPAKRSNDAADAGFLREGEMLKKAGLDISGAVQNDGAGGAALFTPDFMVHYLQFLTTRPFFAQELRKQGQAKGSKPGSCYGVVGSAAFGVSGCWFFLANPTKKHDRRRRRRRAISAETMRG